jgi:hypothetical protein
MTTWTPTAGHSPVSRETVEANISGDVSGQVVVGNHNVQIGSVHGNVVTVLGPRNGRFRR